MMDPEWTELDQVLGNEAEIEPSLGFSARVMRAVREDESQTQPISFPWARLLPGLLLNLVLLLGATAWLVVEASAGATTSAIPFDPKIFADPQVPQLLWGLLTLVGSGGFAWAMSTWSTPRQMSSF